MANICKNNLYSFDRFVFALLLAEMLGATQVSTPFYHVAQIFLIYIAKHIESKHKKNAYASSIPYNNMNESIEYGIKC